MKYRIRHETTYSYADPVDLASHMLHLSPRVLPHQQVAHSWITVDPTPTRQQAGLDYFGNPVHWLFLDRPHESFTVLLEATVDVAFPAAPDAADTPPWETVAERARAGGPGAWQAAEFAFGSEMAPASPEAGDYAVPSFPAGRSTLAGLLDLTARINTDFAYQPGVTTIQTPVAEVLGARVGVCQDFAHVMIAALRAHGLPARYVSGYLRTHPPPGQVARRGADQSHAWVSCWLGPEHGWLDFDPTNNLVVGEEHVVLAWGRDYADVSPIRGVILGGGSHALNVSVDLAPAPSGPDDAS